MDITVLTAILGSSAVSTLLSYFLINRQSHKHSKEIKELESRLQLDAKKNEQLILIEAENIRNQLKQANDDLTKRKELYDLLLENGYRVKKAMDNITMKNNQGNLENLENCIENFRSILFPARKFLEFDGKFDVVHNFIRQAEFLMRLIKDKQSKKQIKEKCDQIESLLNQLYSISPLISKNNAQHGFVASGS
jgi:hypothetical protein